MLTLAPIAPGAPLLYDYMGGVDTLYSTTVRRHLLRRGKMFDCFCEACTAPDQLAALPCPVCVPRDPETGLVPMSLLAGQARELFTHPVVVPDGVSAGASTPPAWRCDTCGGVFSAERMAALQIAAGAVRPSPRTSQLGPSSQPAALLDVARWAESATTQLLLELPHLPVSSTPETKVEYLMAYIYRLAAVVGTAHVSVLRLRYEHFKALHMITNNIPGGRAAMAAAAPKRLSGHVPLLDVQIPALLRLVNAPGAEQVLPPLALATAITANVANVWPRLRAAGLLRPTSTSVLPAYYITLAVELVHCLGMEREPMLARPLRAMLRELPPAVTYSDTLRKVLQVCHHLVRE